MTVQLSFHSGGFFTMNHKVREGVKHHFSTLFFAYYIYTLNKPFKTCKNVFIQCIIKMWKILDVNRSSM